MRAIVKENRKKFWCKEGSGIPSELRHELGINIIKAWLGNGVDIAFRYHKEDSNSSLFMMNNRNRGTI